MKHTINKVQLSQFQSRLLEDERSAATVEKYLRDLRTFYAYIGDGGEVTKGAVIAYKQYLTGRYAPASVNSMLAPLNRFFREMGWYECTVKALKIQRQAFRSKERELTKEEYYRLVRTARERGDERLCLLMQAICATGIRVSELQFLTVEALNSGWATVSLKGKTRKVLLPAALCRKLRRYAKAQGIPSGSIFITRSGRPMDRSNIFHAMKALCQEAGVAAGKVFPHNLRHLFARMFYALDKDISKLADILGHSNINTTRIYIITSGQEHRRRLDALGLVI